LIEGVHRHDAALHALSNENSRHRMIDDARWINATREVPSRNTSISWVSVKNGRGIKPAAAGGIEEPSSIVIRSPAPRLIADPGVAKRGIHDPLPIGERRPPETDAKWSPTKSIGTAVGKGAIGIEIGESRSVIRRTGVLEGCGRGGGDTFDAAGNPAVEVVFFWKPADDQRRIVACFHRKGLALFKARGVLIVKDGNAALIGFDGAAIVVIVQTEGASMLGFHSEVATGDAEVVAACRIHVERSATLSKNESRRSRRVIQGKIVEFQDRVFLEESHGAVLEFHFGAAFVRGQNVSLADGQVQPSGLPGCRGVVEWVAVRFSGEADVALNEAQADDAGMAGIRRSRMCAQERYQQNYQNGRNQFAGNHNSPPHGARPKSLDGEKNGQVTWNMP